MVELMLVAIQVVVVTMDSHSFSSMTYGGALTWVLPLVVGGVVLEPGWESLDCCRWLPWQFRREGR